MLVLLAVVNPPASAHSSDSSGLKIGVLSQGLLQRLHANAPNTCNAHALPAVTTCHPSTSISLNHEVDNLS